MCFCESFWHVVTLYGFILRSFLRIRSSELLLVPAYCARWREDFEGCLQTRCFTFSMFSGVLVLVVFFLSLAFLLRFPRLPSLMNCSVRRKMLLYDSAFRVLKWLRNFLCVTTTDFDFQSVYTILAFFFLAVRIHCQEWIFACQTKLHKHSTCMSKIMQILPIVFPQ